MTNSLNISEVVSLNYTRLSESIATQIKKYFPCTDVYNNPKTQDNPTNCFFINFTSLGYQSELIGNGDWIERKIQCQIDYIGRFNTQTIYSDYMTVGDTLLQCMRDIPYVDENFNKTVFHVFNKEINYDLSALHLRFYLLFRGFYTRCPDPIMQQLTTNIYQKI